MKASFLLLLALIGFSYPLTFLEPKEKNEVITTKIWMGWVNRESGADGFRQTFGDRGRAWGKYQFDYRYGLVPFMQDCVKYNPQRYVKFVKFIDMGAGSASLINNTELQSAWLSFCDNYPIEFERLQDIRGYTDYYLEARKYLINLYGINLDNHSPAMRGTVYSMAIRSGPLNAAWRYEGLTDSSKDETMMAQGYASYGDEDAGRWLMAQQYGDALYSLAHNDYMEIPTSRDSEDIILPKLVRVKTDVYRRKTPDASSSDNIVGTYTTGTIVDVLFKTGNFYMDKENIYFTANPEYVEDITGTGINATSSCRSEPDAGKSVIGYLNEGDIVPLFKRENNFYYVRLKRGGFGWCNGSYIKIN
ncbi:MAG: SH3 domain-containing protein [archaeon]|nr:SH3 domain-containing protein [archaeon]